MRLRNVTWLAASMALVACGGGGENRTAAAGGSAAAGGNKTFTIAMIGKSSSNPVFLSGRTGAEAAAKELSQQHGVNVRVEWLTPPTEDAAVQAQRISQAVNSGAHAILFAASEAGKVVGAINEAVDRGVPVMTFDSDVPNSKRFAFYGGVDEEIGSTVMAELVRQLGGKGKVGILGGNQNAPNLQKRVKGARDEAAKHPGITVANVFYHPETPQDAAAEVLRAQNAYPDITGWAFIGGWPLFTQALLTDLDPNKVKIVSVDGLPAELPYVERGLAPVLFAQPTYLWGYEGVKTIFDHVYLKKQVPQHVKMELVKVSKENLGTWARQLKAWGFTDVDPKYLALPK
ncbi:MAG TPA: substrate-binding domain-containing protein [Gemmatimonadaceae bacterium]|nr:substrate-binding domain-containing protein [Gemmatimonadaceae bacterium]